jgi:hypothetical protein
MDRYRIVGKNQPRQEKIHLYLIMSFVVSCSNSGVGPYQSLTQLVSAMRNGQYWK